MIQAINFNDWFRFLTESFGFQRKTMDEITLLRTILNSAFELHSLFSTNYLSETWSRKNFKIHGLHHLDISNSANRSNSLNLFPIFTQTIKHFSSCKSFWKTRPPWTTYRIFWRAFHFKAWMKENENKRPRMQGRWTTVKVERLKAKTSL